MSRKPAFTLWVLDYK